MAGTDRVELVRAFLQRYASAFERMDKDAVADHFGYPLHVVTYGDTVGLLGAPSRDDWVAVIERILDLYRTIGVRRASVGDLRVVQRSDQVVEASVRWTLRGEGDRLLYEFDAAYTLAWLDGRPKIVQIVAESERPKARALRTGQTGSG